jgi:hypothetical protein
MAHPAHSPLHDGFAAMWNEPALLAAELTWRWCFGLAAWGMLIISAALFLDSVRISPSDQFLLSTLHPRLLSNAVWHLFRGSLYRFMWQQTVMLVGLTLLWAFAATAGRASTLRRLVAMFGAEEESSAMNWEFRPIFVLSLLRAWWTLIALSAMLISLAGGIILAHNQRAARAAFALSFGIGLSWAFGVMLNWFLGLAPLFCIRNRARAPEALTQSVDFFSRQAGRLFGLGVVFGMLRLVWAGTMFFVVFAPLKLKHHVAPGWIALIMVAIALVYFAGADLLYLARLGAYVSLAEDESHAGEIREEAHPGEPPAMTAPVMEPA